MTIPSKSDAQRPAPPHRATSPATVLAMDPAVTIGAAIRAVRRGDHDGALFDALCLALSAKAAEGDPASRVAAAWAERHRTSVEAPR